MSPKDREMMEQIFGEAEAEPVDAQVAEMTEVEIQKINFAMHLITSFDKEIGELIERGTPFFLAPPDNFSYMVN